MPPRQTLSSLVVALLLAGCAASGPSSPAERCPEAPVQPAPAAPAADGPMEFEKYQLVLLRRGPRANEIPEAELAAIQKAHIAHLDKMAEEGAIVAAGPFDDQSDDSLRGLALYRVGSVEEARALAEQDPAVKAGRLRVEVMTWMTAKGYVTFPKAKPRKP
ncbi:YciI family protein [Polyangium sp. 15x6]|uniref:YciI family protein n=1 Tax=Polyangium sp. 15x6 TaxID=3042687 RepID=UPI00249A8E55|nr:YciI family protein [Polyangium sp. 15x6]MDI3286858.1 YciI family protein [Polyangium sp. 15x6]